MLHIHRTKGEEVVIDGGINIRVLSIRRGATPEQDSVTLGFDAPREIAINRKEIDDAIQTGSTGPLGAGRAVDMG